MGKIQQKPKTLLGQTRQNQGHKLQKKVMITYETLFTYQQHFAILQSFPSFFLRNNNKNNNNLILHFLMMSQNEVQPFTARAHYFVGKETRSVRLLLTCRSLICVSFKYYKFTTWVHIPVVSIL